MFEYDLDQAFTLIETWHWATQFERFTERNC